MAAAPQQNGEIVRFDALEEASKHVLVYQSVVEYIKFLERTPLPSGALYIISSGYQCESNSFTITIYSCKHWGNTTFVGMKRYIEEKYEEILKKG